MTILQNIEGFYPILVYMFAHIRGHSTFSMLEAIGKIPDVLTKIKDLGMDAVALTEYDTMSGALQFFQTAHKMNIKPLIGVELGMVQEYKTLPQTTIKGNVVLLAKNYQGYQDILALTSIAHLHLRDDVPYLDIPTIREKCQHLYVLQGGERSFFGSLIAQGIVGEELKRLRTTFSDAFGEAFLADLMVQDCTIMPHIQKLNTHLQQLASYTDTPLGINTNFHYINPEDKEAFEIALAIKDGKKVYQEDRRKVIGDYHIQSPEEILQIMQKNGLTQSQISECIKVNEKIAESIDITIPMGETLFPNYESPAHIQTLYQKYQDELVEKGE